MIFDEIVFYRMPSMHAAGYIDTPAKVTAILEDDKFNLMLDDRRDYPNIDTLEHYTLPVNGAKKITSEDPKIVTYGWYEVYSVQWLHGCVVRGFADACPHCVSGEEHTLEHEGKP